MARPTHTINVYPDDKYGWAVSGGGEINLPWGDTFGANAVYSVGASGYATRAGSWQMYGSNSVGVGWLSDGVFDTGTQIELTRVWSVNAAYQRNWSPQWVTSFYGGYVNVQYNDDAKTIINRHLPGAAGTDSLRSAGRRRCVAAGQRSGWLEQQLQPEFQLHAGRFAHAVEPGARIYHGRRCLLHAPVHGLPRERDRPLSGQYATTGRRT